jgi:cyclin-dependent kinase
VIPLLATHSLPPSTYLLVFPFQPLNLETLLRNPAPPSAAEAKQIIHDLFTALAHLHSIGMIHRDVKPSNILLASPTGPAYLADFGIAWSPHDPASEAVDRKITDVGTTCYRAPELLFGQKAYMTAIDLWAAGCVVAEIVHAITLSPTRGVERQRGDWTLFNAGALGSELALVKSIFETLGTPNEKTWPVSFAPSHFFPSAISTYPFPNLTLLPTLTPLLRKKEIISLPDWNKMTFVDFPGRTWTEILPHASPEMRDLVGGLVKYQSTERMCAADVAGLDVL